LATYDAKAGMGAANRGRFSSPELDALIAKAVVIIDDKQRDAALALASEKAIELMGLIPLHYEVSTWATRKGISYTGRADQYTLAQDAKLAGK
jgi:peptide/nickel transport system substrate-binding protein